MSALASTLPTDAIETRAEEIGREILQRARAAEPSTVRPDFWLDRLMDWSTRDPRRRTQLFRFIDLLPSLTDEADVVAHLGESLLRDGVPLPRGLARLLRSAAGRTWSRDRLGRAVRAGSLRMARRFVAGETMAESIETVQSLRQRGIGFTVDVLGEATTSHAQADAYADQYMTILYALTSAAQSWPSVDIIDRGVDGPMPRVNVSLKLSSLDPNFDPIAPAASTDSVLKRLRPILRLARELGAFVNVDMERYCTKDLTLSTVQQVLDEAEFRDFADVGVVVQAYLKDAPGDLHALLEWVSARGTPIAIRLVKGAYWDVEVIQAVQQGWAIPVLTEKWRSDAQFEALGRKLLDHRDIVRPALASHNVRSLAALLAYAEAIGALKNEYEVQMLFGLGDPLKQAIAGMGYALRVYTPFGELIPGMAYLIRRLLENTSNESFLKHSHQEHEPIEALLANPAEHPRPSPPLPAPLCKDPKEASPMMPFDFEPMTDFSRQDARQAMTEALDAVRADFGNNYPLNIGGKEVSTDRRVDSINPSAKTETVGRVYWADVEHADLAVSAARQAFDERWSATTARQRNPFLQRAAEIMRRQRFELAAWIVFETGKPWREADADVAEAIDFVNYYREQAMWLMDEPRVRDFPGEKNAYLYQPRGVVAVIAPWNFPLAILTGMTTAALAAGNTVVMKPAEQSPVVAAKLMDIFNEAGLPPGVVNLLPGQGELVGARLVEHVGVAVIAFTGSRDVGVSIHGQASQWQSGQPGLKRVIAEMGGKNALIVDADADRDDAVTGVIDSAFGYAGQKCSACSRAIVHEAVRDQMTDRLIEAVRSLRIGPADRPETFVGPLIDSAALAKTLRYIEVGRQEAELACRVDPGALADQGFFAPPTVFVDVPASARIAREEVFGPVLAVISAESFEQALDLANDSDYALTGGLYSRSPSHIEQAKRRFNVGNLYINRKITGALVDRQPFGGFKMSGIGSKAGGPDYLLQFIEPKTIVENTLRHGFTPEMESMPARDKVQIDLAGW